MNQTTWDNGADPQAMLAFLTKCWSERKLRLFACACCRASPRLNVGTRRYQALDVAERFADGLCGADEIERIYERDFASVASNRSHKQFCLCKALANTCYHEAEAAASCVLIWVTDVDKSHLVSPETQCDLLRELAGNLFGRQRDARGRFAAAPTSSRKRKQFLRPVPFDRSLLHWDGGTIVRLARGIYDERRFDDLPILADALEEAGCASADLLGHFRRPDGHVPGCWGLDALLGKR